MKNKRGDIPVTILVIGVFAICALAIFSFLYSTKQVQNNFVGVGLIETVLAVEEEIRFDDFSELGRFSEKQILSLDNAAPGEVEIEVDTSQSFQIIGTYLDGDEVLVSVEYGFGN